MTAREGGAGTDLPADAGAVADGRASGLVADDRLRSVLADRVVLPALLALAAALRFVSLAERGMWDADQGRDLLVLQGLLVDGVAPLLGPVTSIGGIHHGATYYYLLAPFAALGRLDPAVVVVPFAVAGVAMVGLVWWLARSMGGPIAGLAAGLFVACSPPAIAASAMIWNPNLVGPAAALTIAAAWRAWRVRSPRWWVVAIGAGALTVQLHVLATLLAVPVLALLLADLRRAHAPGERARLGAAIAGGIGVAVVLFLPLLVHEVSTGFAELRAAADFIAGPREQAAVDPVSRLLVTGLRMASWPLVGLVVDAPLAAVLLAGAVLAAGVWRALAGPSPEGTGARWLLGGLVWSLVGLAFVAPDLAVVVRGLPNDQYHAFTDPIVPVLLGLGVGGLGVGGLARWRLPARQTPRGALGSRARAPGSFLAIGLTVAVLALEVSNMPPLRDPNGGWPAAIAAAARVRATTADRRLLLVGLPAFKPTDGFVFPLRHAGAPIAASQLDAGALVVVCDRLFEPSIGARCGGEAEAAIANQQPGLSQLVDRFDLSGRTSISVFLPPAGG